MSENLERIEIAVDANTRKRLLKFTRACGGDDPTVMAGALLRDLLFDDEFYNAASEATQLDS
jgi:hypothetical protein